MNISTKTTDPQIQKTDLGCQGWQGEGRDRLGGWGQQMQTLIIKWINNKVYCMAKELYSIFHDKPYWKKI